MNPKYSDLYQEIEILGQGAFGVAHLVRKKSNGVLLVAKKVFLQNMKQEEREKSTQEVHILRQLDSPFVVKYYDSFFENKELIIIMEYCQEGELSNLIRTHKEKKQRISEDVIANWFVQLCLGLKHIHENKIIHRDIKTNNIFLNSNKTIKIGDFGISRVLETISQEVNTFVGTPYYLSPEVCSNQPYGYKSDIWALGCVLYELCTLNFVFDANNIFGLLMKIVQEKVPKIPNDYSKELSDIVLKILSKQVKERPTIDEIFQSSYITKSMKEFLMRKGTININVPVKKTLLHETIQSNIKNSTSGDFTIKSEYINTQNERKLNPKEEAERRKQLKNAEQFQIMSNAAREKTIGSFGKTSTMPRQRVVDMNQINKTIASKTFKDLNQKARKLRDEEEYDRKAATFTKRYDPNDERPMQVTLKQQQALKKVEQKKPVQKPQSDDEQLQQYNDQDFQDYVQQQQIRITQGATKQELHKVQQMYDNQLKNKTLKVTEPLNKNPSFMESGTSFLLNMIETRVNQLVSELGKNEYKKLHDFMEANEEQLSEDSFIDEIKGKFPKATEDQIDLMMEILYRESMKKSKM